MLGLAGLAAKPNESEFRTAARPKPVELFPHEVGQPKVIAVRRSEARTRANENGKGYNTTGIRVQFIQNRLNEVLGIGGHRIKRRFRTRNRDTRQGGTVFEVTCDLTLYLGVWHNGLFVPFAESKASGGHIAPIEADARKGAQTNALKKAAAAFGIGWRCTAGLQDHHNARLPGASSSGRVLRPLVATAAQLPAIAPFRARAGATQADFGRARPSRTRR